MSRIKRQDDKPPIDYICVTPEHIRMGKKIPDGYGTLTVNGRVWAYCSAGLENAPHAWKATGGVPFDTIRHADLPNFPASS